MEKAGYVFDVMSPEVNEKSIKTENPYEKPLILARAKADDLIPKIKEPSIVITSDVIIIAEGRIYEKPETEEEAMEMLKKWSNGTEIDVVCGVVVVNTQTLERYEGIDIAKIFFKEFPDSMLEEFMKYGEPLNRAGAFSVQHPIMNPYVDKIEGDLTTIIGLSMKLLEKLLKDAGYKK